MTTIDEFCSERNLKPNWITLDIEGYEIAAILGARKTIESALNKIRSIVEMHPDLWSTVGTSRKQFEVIVNDLELTITGLTGQADPFGEYGIVRMEPAS